jgi:hypothetical protein
MAETPKTSITLQGDLKNYNPIDGLGIWNKQDFITKRNALLSDVELKELELYKQIINYDNEIITFSNKKEDITNIEISSLKEILSRKIIDLQTKTFDSPTNLKTAIDITNNNLLNSNVIKIWTTLYFHLTFLELKLGANVPIVPQGDSINDLIDGLNKLKSQNQGYITLLDKTIEKLQENDKYLKLLIFINNNLPLLYTMAQDASQIASTKTQG